MKTRNRYRAIEWRKEPRRKGGLCYPVLFVMMVVQGALAAEISTLRGDWWTGPAVGNRHTSFVATFDSRTTNDADMAWGLAGAGGGGMEADVPGKYGFATRVAVDGGHLHFRADDNFNPERGTIRMLVRGDVWRDATPRWLFEARAGIRIGICRDLKILSLVIHAIAPFEAPVPIESPEPTGRIDLPIGQVSSDEWHNVVASWDRFKGMGWIALDGRCAAGTLSFPEPTEEAVAFYLGGGYESRRRGRNDPGLTIDEVVIYDQSIAQMEAEYRPLPREDMDLLPKVETAVRKNMKFIAGLQYGGGWPRVLTWPTLLWAGGAREYVDPAGAICTEGGGTADIAAQFMYAYQVLGDYRWKEVALRAVDFHLAVQHPMGYWHQSYWANGYSVRPVDDERHIKLQDCVQHRPLFLLAYLYRLTGEKKYLEAVKRAGEFMLMAQNPNGSWSHHWDAVSRIGRTEPLGGNYPGGGELNDAATNNAIDSMVLMYHLTHDRRYVEAVRRVGQWLLDAQLKGSMRGWSDQYDQDNDPVMAREFEPRACSSRATRLACDALVEVYRLSGDDRYLRAIRDCLAWLETTFPDGKMYLFHDVETGRPIASWEFKVAFLDDPEQRAWFLDQARGASYSTAYPITEGIKELLRNAARPARRNPEISIVNAADLLVQLRPQVEKLLASQNENGVWTSPPAMLTDMDKKAPGNNFSANLPVPLLRYIEAARSVMGELPIQWRGDGSLASMAYLEENWYDIPWPDKAAPPP